MKKFIMDSEKQLRVLGSIINIFIYGIACASVIHFIYNTTSIVTVIISSIILLLILMVLLFSIKEILKYVEIDKKRLIKELQSANIFLTMLVFMAFILAATTGYFNVTTYENLLLYFILFIIYVIVSNVIFGILKKKYKIK